MTWRTNIPIQSIQMTGFRPRSEGLFNNKGISCHPVLTVNFFDFSEVNVSELGTLTPMEDPDMRKSFGANRFGLRVSTLLGAQKSFLRFSRPKAPQQAVERVERVSQGLFTQPCTRRVAKVNESAWIFAKKYPKHVERRTKPSPTHDNLHRIFTALLGENRFRSGNAFAWRGIYLIFPASKGSWSPERTLCTRY